MILVMKIKKEKEPQNGDRNRENNKYKNNEIRRKFSHCFLKSNTENKIIKKFKYFIK